MNKVFMIGNLTKDPDLRSTGNGVSVCSFRIAVNRRFPNQAGERVSDFFDVVAWRQLADVCGKYLAKGRKVAVVGELQTRTYDAKDGTKRYVTEIIADDVEFLTPRNQEAVSYTHLEGLRACAIRHGLHGGGHPFHPPRQRGLPGRRAGRKTCIRDRFFFCKRLYVPCLWAISLE